LVASGDVAVGVEHDVRGQVVGHADAEVLAGVNDERLLVE
jgi:hypothetical protein